MQEHPENTSSRRLPTERAQVCRERARAQASGARAPRARRHSHSLLAQIHPCDWVLSGRRRMRRERARRMHISNCAGRAPEALQQPRLRSTQPALETFCRSLPPSRQSGPGQVQQRGNLRLTSTLVSYIHTHTRTRQKHIAGAPVGSGGQQLQRRRSTELRRGQQLSGCASGAASASAAAAE